jgi:adenosine deaminase
LTHTSSAIERLRALPKAEVYVYLEGCFDAALLEQLAHKLGEWMPRPRETLFHFEGLADLLQFLDWACGLVRTREVLASAACAFSQRLAASGTGYADLIFNPTHWKPWHARLPKMLDALDAGFRAAEQDGSPPVGLCVSRAPSRPTPRPNWSTC